MSEPVPMRFAPNELQLQLLQAALLDGEPARAAWERSKHAAAAPLLLDVASYRLLPQLYRNLLDVGVEDAVLSRLKGIYRHSWYCNQRLFHEAAEVLDKLHHAGIDTLVLKGGALSILHYRDRGSRPMEDLDVLVRRSDAHRTAELLEAAGWKRARGLQPLETMVRIVSSTGFKHSGGSEIDLHWSPMFDAVPEASFWDHSVELEIGGVRTRALDPTDQFMHVTMHGLGWHPAPLRWISDAVIVARRNDVDWERLAEQAAAWQLSARMETALTFLGERFGVAVPEAALTRLRDARRPLSERIAHRVLVRPPAHGALAAVFWDRYHRMRTVGDGGDELPGMPLTRFPRYMVDSLGPGGAREVLRKAIGGSLPDPA